MTKREKNISRIPEAFRFMLELYREVSRIFGEIQGHLKGKSFVPLGGNSFSEFMSRSFQEEPIYWLLRTPERYFAPKAHPKKLVGVKGVMFTDEEGFTPHFLVAVYEFGKPHKLTEKGEFTAGGWQDELSKETIDAHFVTKKRRRDVVTAESMKGDSEWASFGGATIRYFQVQFLDLESSEDVETKIVEPVLQLVK